MDWVTAYGSMLLIRRFEETVEALFSQGKVRGTTHASCGQEASAVGACRALRPGDAVTSTHRSHGHFLALGGDPRRMMAELFGKATGYSGGRGGSQLMADYGLGFIGANGITGGSIPVATGLALAAQRLQTGRVVACFFGDGATNQGTFHESLNMAAIWRLPVVYICENNQYAMSMPSHQSLPLPDVAARAAAYALPGVIVDGNDAPAVHAAVSEAAELARAGGGPSLVECKTYRFSGHSRGDPRVYRTRAEEQDWRTRDPLTRMRAWLSADGRLDDAGAEAMLQSAEAAVQDAITFAQESPDPDPATLTEGVFAA